MSKGRVLVIDDDEWVCRLLSVAMKEAGFEITLTDTAADGFFRAVEEQPHCIVCDVDLPDHDGYWVARRIRQHPSRVSMAPFVFMSGMDDREHRLEGFSVGGDAYLTKPFRIDEVVAQVEALVQMAARLQKSRATLHSIPPSGPAMLGNLAQMNVATVLTMLDLERRSGKIELARDGEKAEFVLVGGSIASATINGNATASIAAIRIVTAWHRGKFAFTPTDTPVDSAGAEPINALLMEAARLDDEAQEEDGVATASDRLSSAWKESLRSSRIPRAETAPPSTTTEPPITFTPSSSDEPSSDGVPVSVSAFDSGASDAPSPHVTPPPAATRRTVADPHPTPLAGRTFNAVRPPPLAGKPLPSSASPIGTPQPMFGAPPPLGAAPPPPLATPSPTFGAPPAATPPPPIAAPTFGAPPPGLAGVATPAHGTSGLTSGAAGSPQNPAFGSPLPPLVAPAAPPPVPSPKPLAPPIKPTLQSMTAVKAPIPPPPPATPKPTTGFQARSLSPSKPMRAVSAPIAPRPAFPAVPKAPLAKPPAPPPPPTPMPQSTPGAGEEASDEGWSGDDASKSDPPRLSDVSTTNDPAKPRGLGIATPPKPPRVG